MTAHPSPDDTHRALPATPGTPGRPDGALRVLLVDASDRGGHRPSTHVACASALAAEHAEVSLAAPAGVGDPGLVAAGAPVGPRGGSDGKAPAVRAAPVRARPVRTRHSPGRLRGPTLTWSTSRPRSSLASTRWSCDASHVGYRSSSPSTTPCHSGGRGPGRRRPGAAVAGRRRPHHPRRRATPISSRRAPRACPSTSCPWTWLSAARGSNAPPGQKRARPARGSHGSPARPGPALQGIGLLARAWPQVAAALARA